MADQSDVEQAIVNLIATALYPNGSGSGSSISGLDAKIYRGWPSAACLDNDLKAGVVNITVYPSRMEKKTSRYPREWQTASGPWVTLTATVSGNTITIGGPVKGNQNIVVLCGLRSSFSYPVKVTDTLNNVANGIASLIAASFPGTAAVGPVVTVGSGAGLLQARVSALGLSAMEVKRQDKQFQITLWCPTPDLRDRLAKVVDPALAANTFIDLGDHTEGYIRYDHSITDDDPQKELLYRRDLFYWVEYPTIITEFDTSIGDIVVNNTAGQDSPPDGPPATSNI